MSADGFVYGLTLILQADGWRAVFVDGDPRSGRMYYTSQVVCWGLIVGNYGEGNGGIVKGLVAEDKVIPADDMPDFIGYIGPGEQAELYADEIKAKLAQIGLLDEKGTKKVPDGR